MNTTFGDERTLSKAWFIRQPNGKIISVISLNNYCRNTFGEDKRNSSYSNLNMGKSYQGYLAIKATPSIRCEADAEKEFIRKTGRWVEVKNLPEAATKVLKSKWLIETPDRELIEVNSLREFCLKQFGNPYGNSAYNSLRDNGVYKDWHCSKF